MMLKNLMKLSPLLLSVFLLTACGDDAEQQTTAQKDADPVRNLLDEVNKQQIKPPKPAMLSTITNTLVFSSVRLGEEMTLPIVLNAEGDDPLTVLDIKVASEQQVFTIDGSCSKGVILGTNQSSCRIDVTFRPTDPRLYQTSIVVVHSAQNSPLLIDVSGNGELPPQAAAPVFEQPKPPSDLYNEAQRLLAQRKGAALQVLSNGFELQGDRWNLSDKDYAGIGVEPSVSTYPVNRTRMITADRFIPAVMETTVSSEIPGGRMTAIIENNVYSAEGRNILIPAGSRTIGTYEGLGKTGNERLNVTWSRIITPSGVGISVDSPGADPMGRTGLVGDVDNRYFDRYIVPLLVTSMGIAANYAVSPDQVQQTTFGGITDGFLGTVTSETLSKETVAGRQFAAAMLEISKQIIEENIEIGPIVTIPGGTRFTIMPTRDLVLKNPTLISAAEENPDSIGAQAKQLVQAIQRGDFNTSTDKITDLLAKAAQKANASGGGLAGAGVGSNAQYDFGPPTAPGAQR